MKKRTPPVDVPDSKSAANIASLLQNPEVIKGAPANERPESNIKMNVLFIFFRNPPISVINLEPTICNIAPAAMNNDALNIA